jgi:hypothetical protein
MPLRIPAGGQYTAGDSWGSRVSSTQGSGRNFTLSESRELILTEARRLLAEAPDSIPDTVRGWAKELVKWLATAHPGAPKISSRTAEAYLSHVHRIAKVRKLKRR